MNTYTDPRLLGMAEALQKLPALSLAGPDRSREPASGAVDVDGSLVPKLGPESDKPSESRSTAESGATSLPATASERTVDASPSQIKRNDPLTTAVNGSDEWAAPDSNWRLLPCEDSALTN
jgi:hypothetical protein